MSKHLLVLAALAGAALVPATASAQHRYVGGPVMGGPAGRPVVGNYGSYGPYITRPAYYSNYDPLGYNYPVNRQYWNNNFSNQRYYAGLFYGNFGYNYAPIYVPYFSTTYVVPVDSYDRTYPPGDVFPGVGPGVGPAIETGPRPRIVTASVEVYVPNSGAELWFNGVKTQQGGQKRQFVTPELSPGKVFSYDVRARWTENGKEFDQTRTVMVQAGAQVVYAFYADDTKEKLPNPDPKDK